MRTDFNINVHVDLGVTPELVALVKSILNKQPEQPTVAVVEPQPEQQQAASEETKKPSRKKKPEAEQPTEEVSEEEPQAQEAEPQPEAEKQYTTEDVRDAMERTRKRIEGENYKNETDSENYKRYHKALNQQFKLIAATLGADKPSALSVEQIPSFISQCDELVILESGEIGVKCPF